MLQRVLQGVLDTPVEPLKAGRYVLLEAVGRGGVGEVYAAYDPELDRRVAVKLVRADVDAWGDLERRMQREAQAMARVRHPNVVAIHDVGQFRNQVFIAMELLEGMTLSAWNRAAQRSWSDVRDVFVQAGRGLSAVHEANMVLRDFKPANVWIGDDGLVKVLDFGLARAVAGQPRDVGAETTGSVLDEELTGGGILAGTPAYMAPEQSRGAEVGAAADQFAFCVALYESLWGERPFPGSDLAQRGRAIDSQNLDPPSTVPPWLRAAVLRGLAPSPADRHASMQALVSELGRDRRRRTKTWLAIGAAALLSAAATATVLTVQQAQVTGAMMDRVEALEREARAAADAKHFVYPPLDDPFKPTAYSRTLALEHVEGPAAELAQQRAGRLRQEFSVELTALGDAYSKEPAGAPFAADFYAAAVLFDASNEHARAGSLLTASQLSALRGRAERGEFAPAELVVGASLAALAQDDLSVRRAKVVRLRRSRPDAPASTLASLESLIGSPLSPPAPMEPDILPSTPARLDLGGSDETAASTQPDVVPDRGTTPDRRSATALAKEGLQALRAHELKRAELLLNRAIAADRKNAAALAGLARFHFELGRYANAVSYAQKAVAAAPKRGRYRMLLGDAYFKVLRFEDARSAYAQARRLGASEAQRALDRVDAKLGR